MSHRAPRHFRFLLIAALVPLTLLASVACTAAKPTLTRSPAKIATARKIARPVQSTATSKKITSPVQPTATSRKIARPVQTTEIAANTANGVAPAAIDVHIASDGTLPKGAGQPPMRLVIPRMKLDVDIREATRTIAQQSGHRYVDWFIPFDAVGHIGMTANTGESGNMVISGHHNLIGPNKFGRGLFGGMWDLKVGDAVYVLDKAGRAFAYEVTRSYKVKEEGESLSVRTEHAREILADTGEPILTLITCWNGAADPYSGNTYRWIVAAHLVNAIDSGQVPVVK